MSLKTISICSFSVRAEISGPVATINKLEASTFLNEYIPGFRFDNNGSTSVKIEINTKNKENITISESDNTAHIHLGSEYSAKDIISLVELVLEFYRQKNGIFTIHGSACDFRGSGILIIGGASGIGKSSLAYKLSEKKNDISFIGDEKICINENGEIIGGILKTGLNQKNHKSYLDEELSLWHGNISRISAIIQPIICDDGKLSVFEWDAARKRWHLYEEFTRKIRAVSRIVAGNPVQSIDNNEIAIKRLNFVDSLVSDCSIKAFSVQGDILAVAKYVQNYVTRNSNE